MWLLLLIGGLGGCCGGSAPEWVTKGVAPLKAPDAIVGRYDDTHEVRREQGASLWGVLTWEPGHAGDPYSPGQTVIERSDGQSIQVARVVNGTVVGRKTVGCEFRDGYVLIKKPRFFTIILVTAAGCHEMALGLGQNGELRVQDYGGAGILFFTVIPLFPEKLGHPSYGFRRAAYSMR